MPIWTGAGGVWKPANDWDVGASGAHKNVDALYVGAGGAWKAVKPLYSRTTLTPGNIGGDIGYSQPAGLGSIASAATADGKTIYAWRQNAAAAVKGDIHITGFTSDPGQTGWAYYFMVNGAFRLASAATSYAYFSGEGRAVWEYDTVWGFTTSVPVIVEIG